MTRITRLLALLPAFLFQTPLIAAEPAHTWSKGFGGIGSEAVADVVADDAGNVYMAGGTDNTISFGGAAITSVGGHDMYLAKFDVMGQHVWSKRLGGTAEELAMTLALDAAGDVYLGGTYNGTIDFGDGNVTNQGGTDAFIVKYSSSGAFQWKHTGGSTGDQIARSIALDTAGNVYLAGRFVGSMDLGGGPITSAGNEDMYIIKYSSSGAFLWQQRFGDSTYQTVNAITTDGMDNVFLFGTFQGTVNFGAGNMTSVGSANMAVAKFNSAGVCQWSKRFGFGSNFELLAIKTDSVGSVYITGHYLCCLDFGGGFMFENGGLYDIFLAKFDASGAHVWSKDFGDNNVDFVQEMAIDANDNVYLYGMFRGTVNFGGGPLSEYPDLFWTPVQAAIDALGNHVWSRRFHADLYPKGLSLKADALYFAGSGGNADLGGGLLPYVGGGSDVYLARHSEIPVHPGIAAITDVAGDQGRQVSIQFSRSGYDAPGSTAITRYEVFRKQDELAAQSPAALAPPDVVALPGWVFTGTVASSGENEYVTAAPTLIDSTIAHGPHFSKFLVRAAAANPLTYFDSPPDSGYSLDNLAPGAPSDFAYLTGVLSWDVSPAVDFDYFTVYGSSMNSFGSATIIDYTISTSMDVTASPYAYYFVTATDFSGNEGLPASLATPTPVGGPTNHFVLSISAYPNPFNPQTTIRYTVPTKGRVAVELFDARGSRVTTLFDGVREAGEFTLGWNGENDAGSRLSSGVYFARVTRAAQSRSYKLVLLK